MEVRNSHSLVRVDTPDREELFHQAVEIASGKLKDTLFSVNSFLVVTHVDADGIAAAGIFAKMLEEHRKFFLIRSILSLDTSFLEEIKTLPYDAIAFLDLGSAMIPEIEEILPDKPVFVLDHHASRGSPKHVVEVNPYRSGFDGDKWISGAAVTYLTIRSLISNPYRLAPLAIVGALGDLQDRPINKLQGMNRKIAKEAALKGYLKICEGIVVFGWARRPVEKAVACMFSPYVPGISGDEAAASNLLIRIGIRLVDDSGRPRRPADLSPVEQQVLARALAEKIASMSGQPVDESAFFGENYVITEENPQDPTYDAREFSSLLNACGKGGRSDIGIAIALGDRGRSLEEAYRLMEQHRQRIASALSLITNQGLSRQISPHLYVIDAGNLIDERLISSVVSILATSGLYPKDSIVVGLAEYKYRDQVLVKVSARYVSAPGKMVQPKLHLGRLLGEIAEAVGGVGGGHGVAAGASFDSGHKQKFIELVRQRIETALA